MQFKVHLLLKHQLGVARVEFCIKTVIFFAQNDTG